MTARRIPLGLAAPVSLAMIAVVLVPCASLLIQSLDPAGDAGNWPDFGNFAALFDSKIGYQALERTIRISVLVTVICIAAGYPVALFISRTGKRWRAILLALVIFPFLISAVVRAFGWTVILGRSGLVNEALMWTGIVEEPLALVQNEIGIIVGETHLLLPYMILSLLAVIQRIDPNLKGRRPEPRRHAGRRLLAGGRTDDPARTADRDVAGVQPGNDRFCNPLPARRRADTDPDDASLPVCVRSLRLDKGGYGRRRASVPRSRVRHVSPRRVGPGIAQLWLTQCSAWGGVFLAAFAVFWLAFLMTPIAVTAIASLTSSSYLVFPPAGLSLQWYAKGLEMDWFWSTLGNSLIIAVGSTTIAVAIGIAAGPASWRATASPAGARSNTSC